jgi:transposase
MAVTERITMTMRELDRFKVIQDVADGKLKPWRAAERLELTTRQVRRLVARLREHGPAGLVSGHRAKPGNRRLDPGAADRALSIIRDRYADFGPTLACEKLWECHGIRLAKETVRKLMTEAGLWIPRRQRPPKVYQPRARRACLGELIQIDGSDHRWFEERAPACMLLVYVDDATSRLMMLHFTQTESTFSYFEATRTYIERHGKPGAFYSDKTSVFRNVKPGKTGVSDTLAASANATRDSANPEAIPADVITKLRRDLIMQKLLCCEMACHPDTDISVKSRRFQICINPGQTQKAFEADHFPCRGRIGSGCTRASSTHRDDRSKDHEATCRASCKDAQPQPRRSRVARRSPSA